jgi:hypothetical protein
LFGAGQEGDASQPRLPRRCPENAEITGAQLSGFPARCRDFRRLSATVVNFRKKCKIDVRFRAPFSTWKDRADFPAHHALLALPGGRARSGLLGGGRAPCQELRNSRAAWPVRSEDWRPVRSPVRLPGGWQVPQFDRLVAAPRDQHLAVRPECQAGHPVRVSPEERLSFA